MSFSTLAGQTGADHAWGDRIDVTDDAGVRIGWVDPRTGVRNLLAPGRRAEFDQMIDYWLAAAGLSAPDDVDPTPVDSPMRIREVRYPDAEVVRSLLIPLRRLP